MRRQRYQSAPMQPQIHNQPLGRVHPGLLVNKLGLHALLTEPGGEALLDKKKMAELRQAILKAAAGACCDSHFLNPYWEYLDEWRGQVRQWVEEGRAACIKAQLLSRLAVGVSAAAAMRTGITLHHTYGVPVIPGSSLKGACRAAARKNSSPQEIQEIEELYGPDTPQRGGPGGTSQGRLVFCDALPCEIRSLELDIMTPHHSKYYQGIQGYEKAPDIEDPVPVPYLTTPPKAEFLFVFLSLAQDRPTLKQDLDKALEHWRATEEEGLGGMTSSGYGWFQELEAQLPPPAPGSGESEGGK